jgi:hypothetical protein
LRAGWISTATSSGSVALESTSAQIGLRFPVSASINTIGWRRRLKLPMSLIGTAPVARRSSVLSIPGTWSTIGWPGLNPSLRL